MVPEGRGVFARLSVTENLEMGAYSRSDKKELQDAMESVYSLSTSQGTPQQVAGTYPGEADACTPGAPYVEANTDADGRAIDGACPGPGRADL